jgi:hypothetical protein
MAILASVFLILTLLTQTAGLSPAPAKAFTSEEYSRLAASKSPNNRISIYDEASERIQKDLQAAAKKEQFETVPDLLTTWISLLQTSLEDIETNSNANKKTKKLRKFEIHLRKAIKDLRDIKLKAPVEQQDTFDSGIVKAETIRKKLIDILFKR